MIEMLVGDRTTVITWAHGEIKPLSMNQPHRVTAAPQPAPGTGTNEPVPNRRQARTGRAATVPAPPYRRMINLPWLPLAWALAFFEAFAWITFAVPAL